jgi:hypothetical protein
LAVWFFVAHGWLMYFGDAEAHLNIARRLVDNQTPGLDQFGSPWLPLPHLITAPFAASDAWWQSGLAGSIPAAACFIAAALFLFHAVREVFETPWPAWTAMLVMLLNPNALYLQSTAMTEPIFAATLCGLLFFTVRFRRSQHVWDVVGAGLCAIAGTLTRYEGWLLLPFCALYFFVIAKKRWRDSLLFSTIAALGPLIWLAYNWWLTGNPLYFYNGAGSAKAIQGGLPYPGFHSWPAATLYFRTCVRLVLGWPLFLLMGIGLIAAFIRRAWQPVLLLAIPPIFYVWSVHSSYIPIFMPELPPHSWYNTRYGLAALPLAAFCAGAITRTRLGFAIVAVSVIPWLIHPTEQNWITWKESEQNSISRRAWTNEAANFLHERVLPGEHIAAEFNDTIGVFRYAGIHFSQVFHAGNTLLWEAAVQRPDLFLNTTWVLCQRADWSVLCSAVKRAPRYALDRSVVVPGAPPVDIYHRDYQHDYSLR